jgi:hypothetical protein
MDQAAEIQHLRACCNDLIGVLALPGLEPDKPEDITDIERALWPPVPVTVAPKTGRNDPCPCGSGKKFKKCYAGTASAGPEKGETRV